MKTTHTYDIPLFNDDRKQVAWNVSSINALQKCKRYYYYSMVQGWKPRNKSVDLIFGGLFAAAVEEYYGNGRNLNNVVHELLKTTYHAPAFATEELKTRRALITAFVEYIDLYEETDGPYISSNEQQFTIHLTDHITLMSRFDLLKKHDDYYQIIDQKTTRSSLSQLYFNTFTPNNQVSLQLYAGNMLFSNPVRNMIIDAVQITRSRPRFLRGVVSRTREQLDDWAYGLVTDIYSIEKLNPTKETEWPQNPTACGYFRGCEFREVCSASPKFRQAYLKEKFTHDVSN